MEKIIQVPLELPELKKSKLYKIFLDKLDKIIRDLPNEIVWDEIYWKEVFNNCVGLYLHTLRDVNRVINIFGFRYEILYQETSFEDMVAITTLEVLEPKLYKWICDNKSSVCKGSIHRYMVDRSSAKNYKKCIVMSLID